MWRYHPFKFSDGLFRCERFRLSGCIWAVVSELDLPTGNLNNLPGSLQAIQS